MKTEAEFNARLRVALRRARRGHWLMPVVKKMKITSYAYFAYENGDLPITAYQLYKFMQITGSDIRLLQEVFDDTWRNPIRLKPQVTDNE